MSLRRRDLFWQNSEKGGGPGDGDVIHFSSQFCNIPGTLKGLDFRVQASYVWLNASTGVNCIWDSSEKYSASLLGGNALISPDGTKMIWPSICSGSAKTYLKGQDGIWKETGSANLGKNTGSWEVTQDPLGRTVLASQKSLSNSATSSFMFLAQSDIVIYACSDGENNYDYLTIFTGSSVTSTGSALSFRGKSQAGSAYAYTSLSVSANTVVKLQYGKDGSQTSYTDRAYVYLEKRDGTALDMNSTLPGFTLVEDSLTRCFEVYDVATQTRVTKSLQATISGSTQTYYTLPKTFGSIYDINSTKGSAGCIYTIDDTNVVTQESTDLSAISSSVGSQNMLTYLKWSDDGNIAITLPQSGTLIASSNFQDKIRTYWINNLYLAKRDSAGNYVSTLVSDLLPVESGSLLIPTDAAFSKTGKTSYILGTNINLSSGKPVYEPRLYKSANKGESYSLLNWNPKASQGNEYLVGVCTDFSGKVVYVETALYGDRYRCWVSASVYRSQDGGQTFNLQSKVSHRQCSFVSGSDSSNNNHSSGSMCCLLNIKYRPQIACSGDGNVVALGHTSGSYYNSQANQNTFWLFRSENGGVSWPQSKSVSSNYSSAIPRILGINRN